MEFRSGSSLQPTAVEEAREVVLIYLRLAGCDVVQLPTAHPVVQGVDERKQVIEGVHDVKQWLVMVDLKGLVNHPLQHQGPALDLRRIDGMRDLSVGAKQPAPVHLQPV